LALVAQQAHKVVTQYFLLLPQQVVVMAVVQVNPQVQVVQVVVQDIIKLAAQHLLQDKVIEVETGEIQVLKAAVQAVVAQQVQVAIEHQVQHLQLVVVLQAIQLVVLLNLMAVAAVEVPGLVAAH
jgi:hypothetical protein